MCPKRNFWHPLIQARSYKEMATRIWNSLVPIDAQSPWEGYELKAGDKSVIIGCAAVDFKEAGDSKGGQRVCLLKAASALHDAKSRAASTDKDGSSASSSKRQKV